VVYENVVVDGVVYQDVVNEVTTDETPEMSDTPEAIIE